MATAQQLLWEIALDEHGFVTTDDAKAVGVTPHALRLGPSRASRAPLKTRDLCATPAVTAAPQPADAENPCSCVPEHPPAHPVAPTPPDAQETLVDNGVRVASTG